MDVEEDELDEGDEFTCEECGAEVAVVGTDPLEIEPLSDDDEDEDEDDDEDLGRRGRRRGVRATRTKKTRTGSSWLLGFVVGTRVLQSRGDRGREREEPKRRQLPTL